MDGLLRARDCPIGVASALKFCHVCLRDAVGRISAFHFAEIDHVVRPVDHQVDLRPMRVSLVRDMPPAPDLGIHAANALEILYGEKANSVPSQAYLNLSPERLVLLNDLWEDLKVENTIGNGIYICCGIILAAIILLTIVQTVKKRKRAKYYTEQPK